MRDAGHQPVVRAVTAVGRIMAGSFLGLLALAAGCQRSLMYFPRRADEATLVAEAAQRRLRPWPNPEGDGFGWRREAASADAQVVLVFHGNGGCAVDRSMYADALDARPGGVAWRTAILEYPGYGARAGSPSERSIQAAALEALDALHDESSAPVWLLGESLGSAVACLVAAERPEQVAGLLLVTPFPSMVEVASHHYPWLPVRWLLRDRFEARKALANYPGPVAVVLAGADEVVPARLGQALYDSISGPRKLWVQEGRTHNTLDLWAGAPWWDEAMRFLLDASSRAED